MEQLQKESCYLINTWCPVKDHTYLKRPVKQANLSTYDLLVDNLR